MFSQAVVLGASVMTELRMPMQAHFLSESISPSCLCCITSDGQYLAVVAECPSAYKISVQESVLRDSFDRKPASLVNVFRRKDVCDVQ